MEGTYQTNNILGNPITGNWGSRRYLDGQIFTRPRPEDIIDFDIEDPEGFQEILSLIEDMETDN